METDSQFDGPLSASPAKWFARGCTVGVLIIGAANALSYFFRSDGLGNLLGLHPNRIEAIGFPLEIWERGNDYNGYFVDYQSVIANMLAGVVFSSMLGLWAARSIAWLNHMAQRFEMEFENAEENIPFQFSLRGLLGATALVAVIAGLWQASAAARPELLGSILLLGPVVLVVTAMVPRNIPWQQRVAIIIPSTFALIAAAIAIGGTLVRPLEFDQVLLGVFVCWTPQTVVAAIGITTAILWQEHRRHHSIQSGTREMPEVK